MPYLTAGVIDNTSVSPNKIVTRVSVRIENEDITIADPPAVIQVRGYYLSGTTRVQYVLEQFTVAPQEVITRIYNTTGFSAFEFEFEIFTVTPLITMWGKNAVGDIIDSYRVLTGELVFVS